jgi:hypothetical protein
VEGRAATFIKRTKQGKAAGLPPQGKAQPRPRQAKRKAPARLDHARKLQRTLYRVAKQQPERRFTLLYDKVCRQDILQEAWQRVKSNKGAAGVDQVDIDAIREYGEERFLSKSNRSCGAAVSERWCGGFTYRSPDSRGKPGRWASRR